MYINQMCKTARRVVKQSTRGLAAAFVLGGLSSALAAPPDATTSYIDTQYTYNLGPTGARGWVYNSGNEWVFAPEGLTYESRQILITTVDAATPAAGVLQVNDVILGIGSTLFTNDARKAFGKAIGAAEASDGQLRLKVWRSGVTNDNVTLTLPVMGAYSATAPYNCPKSALILSNACNFMESRAFNGSTEGNAVFGLALLAAGRTQDLAKVQAYARSIVPNYTSLDIPVNAMVAWPRGYSSTFLSEYYLVTNDAAVLPAIRELSTKSAMGASWVGTYGHGMAWPRLDGTSTHGAVPPYGALNQAGLMVSIGIALGEKCGATNAVISEALGMSRRYFAYFAGKGAVPYGESPPEEFNDDNGKSGEAALLLALQGQADMSPQVRFFSKSCTASYSVREFGHCGPFWAKLWQPMAVNLGGTNALAAYFKEIDWELDLSRRPDGSFVTFGTVGNDGGLDANSGTALYILTYALPLKKIHLTGKDSSTNNWLGAGDVSEAIEAGKCDLIFDMKSWTTNQLLDTLSSWSSQTRRYASEELAARSNAAALVPALMEMAEGTNVYLRMGAVKTLTNIGDARAVPVLLRRLKDSDYFVRYLASGGWTATSGMLTKDPVRSLYTTNLMQIIIDNAKPQTPVEWDDPCQIAQYWLAAVVFNENLKNKGVEGIDTNLLYTAITTWAQGPSGWTLAAGFLNTALRTNDVAALAPFITRRIMIGNGIGYEGGPYINLLAKYDYDDGIAAGMLFDRTFCGRSSNGSTDAVKGYGAAARATLPNLYYWNTHASGLALENVANGWLDTVISTIQNDTVPPRTLRSFKTVTSASATPAALTLPAATVSLSSSGTTLTGDELAYSWIKAQGPGEVTFSTNSTPSSSNAVATFSMPGVYVIRAAISDNFLGDGTNCFGAVFSNLVITVSDTTNAAPVAQNQSLATPLNTAKAVTLAATDANNGTLAYSIVDAPSHGALSGTAPSVMYTPAAGYTGPDSFTFTATDGIATSATATVTIDVGGTGNRRPVADNQALTTAEDTAQAITLTGSDPDMNALTYTVVTSPAHGTLSGTPPNVTYTPAADYPASYFNGADSFTFAVSDASLTSAVAIVSITMTPVEDTPTAHAQTVVMAEDVSLQAVTLSGTDPEGYPLTYAVTAYPALGTIRGAAPDLTYTPPANYFGTNTLTFTVTDVGGRVSPVATVSLVVTNLNDAPRALNRSLPVITNTPTAILLDGSDIEGDALTYTVLTQPAHGTLAGTAPDVIYTPSTNFNRTDTFTFKVNDGKVDSTNVATVYMSVGTVSNGLYSEFFQSPVGLNPFPDMANLVPDATRIDADTRIEYSEFPPDYMYNFSARLIGYIYIPTAGSYGWVNSCDDKAKIWIDEEQLVITDPNWGSCAPRQLTAGYHGIRVEYVQFDGNKYIHINGPDLPLVHWIGDSTPLAPTSLVGTPGNTMIELAWTAVGSAASYNVKRSTLSGGPYTTVATHVTAASTIDSGLVNNTPYYYVVSSVGISGEGVDSAEVMVTPLASASLVTFEEGNLNVNALVNPTGTEIQNDGTLVRAYHFGNHDSITDIIVHGVLFMAGGEPGNFTDTAMSGAWGAGYSSWNGDWSLNSLPDPAYRQLLSSMLMTFSGATITISGLTAGHTYRLQLISNNPRYAQIEVEGSRYTLSGGDNANPVMLTASWIAGDTTLNMSVLNDNLHFCGYALHDITLSANQAPVITEGTATAVTMSEDGNPTPFSLILNATDTDSDTLTWSVSAPAAHGTATASGTGTSKAIGYMPNANYSGSDTFTVLVSDGNGGTDMIAVNVTVEPVNDAPVANAQSVTTAEETAKALTLTGSDVEGSTLSYAIVVGPSHGTLTGTAPDVTYTPAAGYAGLDSFTFTANDGTVDSAPATVSVTVTPVNHAPVANAQSTDAPQGVAKALTLSGSDVDAGTTLTYVIVTSPAHGTLSGAPPNVIYTPSADYVGPDAFTFKVNDGTVDSAPATVSISITFVAIKLAEDFEHEWADNALANMTNNWSSQGSDDLSSVTNPATGYGRLAGNVSSPLLYDHKILKRRLTLNSQASTLTTPHTQAAFTNARVYVDMMVKLVVSDSFAPAPSGNTEVKVAVCLKADGATTNLCIFHGQKADVAFSAPGWTPVMDGASLGEWVRLTVVFDATSQGNGAEAFRVLINGQAVTSSAAYGDDWKTAAFTSPYTPAGGTWFLSAARRATTNGANPGTIDGLSFQGTGFIDDLTVTYDEPIFVHGTVLLFAMTEGNW